MSTSTVGFPSLTIFLTSLSWTPGIFKEARDSASPVMLPLSPTAETTMSARAAASMASANPAVDVSVMPQPFATRIVALGNISLIPSSKVTTESA